MSSNTCFQISNHRIYAINQSKEEKDQRIITIVPKIQVQTNSNPQILKVGTIG